MLLNLLKVLKELNVLTESDIEEEIVQKICGILDVNTFELRSSSKFDENQVANFRRGVYLKASLMAHDCVKNTHIGVDDNCVMHVHASRDIEEDEPILYTYCSIVQVSSIALNVL